MTTQPTLPEKVTPLAFADAILKAIGAPITKANETVLVAWEGQEGGHWNNTRTYNPLNTTFKEPGATYGGAQGNIAAYTSWEQGLDATVRTLTNGRYANIVADLRGNAAPSTTAHAITSSPWGTKVVDVNADWSSYAGLTKAKGDGGGNHGLFFDPGKAVGDVADHIPGVAQVKDVAGAVVKVTEALFSVSFWIRVAFILGGFALLYIGVRALVDGTSPSTSDLPSPDLTGKPNTAPGGPPTKRLKVAEVAEA